MPRLLLSLVLSFPFICVAQQNSEQNSRQTSQQSDSVIVSQLNLDWIGSYAKRDTATMQRILADDFLLISPIGTKFDRASTIRNVGSKEATTIATVDSSTVRVFGNTALLIAYTHFSMTSKGQTTNGRNCYSDLYIKRNGVWQAVSGHVTMLNAPTPKAPAPSLR
jgi:ketosteroid isomerase-like protein